MVPKCTYDAGKKSGFEAGISDVIEQCTKEPGTVYYNGHTGDAMVCGGVSITQPPETPGKALPEPPSGIAGQPEHGSIPHHMEDTHPAQEV